MAQFLYHLVPKSQWSDCQGRCTPYYPATYTQDGFIHLTKEASLLLPVANHFYKDVPGMCLQRLNRHGDCVNRANPAGVSFPRLQMCVSLALAALSAS